MSWPSFRACRCWRAIERAVPGDCASSTLRSPVGRPDASRDLCGTRTHRSKHERMAGSPWPPEDTCAHYADAMDGCGVQSYLRHSAVGEELAAVDDAAVVRRERQGSTCDLVRASPRAEREVSTWCRATGLQQDGSRVHIMAARREIAPSCCRHPTRASRPRLAVGVATRRHSNMAREGDAERARGGVTHAPGHLGKASLPATQQILRKCHSPGEQIVHRRGYQRRAEIGRKRSSARERPPLPVRRPSRHGRDPRAFAGSRLQGAGRSARAAGPATPRTAPSRAGLRSAIPPVAAPARARAPGVPRASLRRPA